MYKRWVTKVSVQRSENNLVETALSPSTFMWVLGAKLRLSGLYNKYFYRLVRGSPLGQVTTILGSSAVPPWKKIVPAGLVDCFHPLVEGLGGSWDPYLSFWPSLPLVVCNCLNRRSWETLGRGAPSLSLWGNPHSCWANTFQEQPAGGRSTHTPVSNPLSLPCKKVQKNVLAPIVNSGWHVPWLVMRNLEEIDLVAVFSWNFSKITEPFHRPGLYLWQSCYAVPASLESAV